MKVTTDELIKAHEALNKFAGSSDKNRSKMDEMFEKEMVRQFDELKIREAFDTPEKKQWFIDNGMTQFCILFKQLAPDTVLQIAYDYLHRLGKYKV